MKETLIFYKDWWEAIKSLPADMQLEVYNSVCAYAFEDIVPTNPMIAAVTALMRSAIDRDNSKWGKVREKRRAAIKSRWGDQKAITQEATNDATNISCPDKDAVNGDYRFVVAPQITKGDFLKSFFDPKRQEILDSLCMSNHIDMDTLRRLAKEVTDEWEVIAAKPHKDESDARQHLIYQIKYKIQAERRNDTAQTDRQRNSADARQQEFKQHIATRLSTPGPAKPDVESYY